jgi:demethylspheroidene O-methyltransferase
VNEPALRALTFGFRAARLAMAGVSTGVFEALAEQPRTAEQVASACSLAPRGARVLLEALAALALLERRGDTFRASDPVRRVLTAKGEASRRHVVLHDLWHWGLWARLEESLESGAPISDRGSDPFFSRTEVLSGFFPNLALAMAETSHVEARALAKRLELPERARVLDLGGGVGQFARAIAAARPDAEVVVFDLPPVAAEAERSLAAAGLGRRARAVAGDFERDPLDAEERGFDRVVLSRVLMGLDDERATRLLRRSRSVLRAGGSVDVCEPRRGPGSAGRIAALLDVDMLLLSGGSVRSVPELRTLLEAAGLAPGFVRPLGRWLIHLEGRP